MNRPLSPQHFIPYGRQWIEEPDIEAVARVLRGDWLTTGPEIAGFESDLADATGARRAVALNSGTAALHAAYHVAGLGEGDQIITSPLTFAATANAALYVGSEVCFADIDPDTGGLDPEAAKACIGDRTKAIVAVDYAGHPADYDAISEVAEPFDLTVIADAAHSLGARRGGRDVGTLADLTTLSFHPVKPITCGEGGAVLTDDDRHARLIEEFRTHGITRDQNKMVDDEGPWHYEMHALGFNYRITDMQCALGRSQLQRLADHVARRRQIAARYMEAFASIDELQLPVVDEEVESGWHLFVVRVQDAKRRRLFFERLQQLRLGVQVHYRPVYLHPYYRSLGYEPGLCPRAEDFYRRAVSLPLFPAMTDDEVQAVISRVRRAVRDVL